MQCNYCYCYEMYFAGYDGPGLVVYVCAHCGNRIVISEEER
jgi:hypothetical protein